MLSDLISNYFCNYDVNYYYTVYESHLGFYVPHRQFNKLIFCLKHNKENNLFKQSIVCDVCKKKDENNVCYLFYENFKGGFENIINNLCSYVLEQMVLNQKI